MLEPYANYKQLLIDVIHDLKNLRDEKKKQLIERDGLVESIASLEKHGAFLKRIEAKEQFATPSIKERSLFLCP